MTLRKVLAEALGALVLAACVIGSGIMAERLAGGNAAVALMANTFATMAVLTSLIVLFGPISGAHFNPVVSAVAACELPLVNVSNHMRSGVAQWLSELVATAGLVLVAFRSPSFNEAAWRVALWIGAAYWFTASTSFANPAITIGRALSDTFAGIRPADAPGFIVAQAAGAVIGAALLTAFRERKAAA